MTKGIFMRIHVVLGVLLFSVTAATAGLVPIGDPFQGHSWGQTFQVSEGVAFDSLVVQMTSPGDYFESATFRNFSLDGWQTVYERDDQPTLAVAEGPGTDGLNTDIMFTGDPDNPVDFNFNTYDGSTPVESYQVGWNGYDWQVTLGDVPAPGAVVLGVIGLGLIGWAKRRIG